eukprot:97663-Alexandrium_andersonii.AAC.1
MAGDECIGRPPEDREWTASGEDPAEVAGEAGGFLAVPSATTQAFWDDVMDQWTTRTRGPNNTAWLY